MNETQAQPAASRPQPALRIAITNDFEIVVAGLSALIAGFSSEMQVVACPVRGAPVPEPVDLALFDTFGHPNLGLDEIHRLRVDPNVARIAVYTWQFDPGAVEASLAGGVRGYLSKNLTAAQLVSAIERICAGEIVVSPDPGTDHHGTPGRNWPGREHGLSERESEVLALIAEGLSNDEIATTLYLSANSVKTHIRNGYRKLEVTTRAQAVRAVLDRGMVRRPLFRAGPVRR